MKEQLIHVAKPHIAVIQAYRKRDANYGGKEYHISIKIMKI